MSAAPVDIATQVVRWQQVHGRQHLPWQQQRTPYRVWLSEIMLQQTQVATVLGYYQRFLERFPDVQALAAAPLDDVLALWSGLGYYSRARNLHRCARIVVSEHGGAFPASVDALAALPGIGRSTAGAIAAFCFGQRAPILDANVRRVLTRVLGFGDDLAKAVHERALWARAQDLLPRHEDAQELAQAMAAYTQGLMDLGAGICQPRQPHCLLCPLQTLCVAQQQGRQQDYPVRTRQLKRQAQAWWLLLLRDAQGRWLLQRRPGAGIWAGLYCPQVFDSQAQLMAQLGALLPAGSAAQELPVVPHVLTHRDLYLHPVLVQAEAMAAAQTPQVGDAPAGAWFDAQQWPQLGLPAPVRKLLESLEIV